MSEQQRTVVMTDIHGYSEKLQGVVDYYGDDVRYVIGGDFINKGPDSMGVMDILSELDDPVLLAGNHEYGLMAALEDVDPHRNRFWLDGVWLPQSRKRRMEKRFLASYGIPEYRRTSDTKEATKVRLQELGHYDLLKEVSLYYEDEDMVVIHAGLKRRITWAKQRAALETMGLLRNHGVFYEIPQLSNTKLSCGSKRPSDLDKTLVTGHKRPNNDGQRVWRENGEVARVMLDNSLSMGNGILVYEAWSSALRLFPRRPNQAGQPVTVGHTA